MRTINGYLVFNCICFGLALGLLACKRELYVNGNGNLVPRTVKEDTSLPSITINGAKLHAQAFGPIDSPLIVCIHGGPGANFQYMLNCKSLATKGYRVVFYDQRGTGLSERFPKKWYVDQGANAIDKIFYSELQSVITHYKTNPTQKVTLLGHSWGAILSSGFAAKHPHDIQGLILMEPGGLKWEDINFYLRHLTKFKPFSEALNDITYIDQFITGYKNEHEVLDYKLALASASNTNVTLDEKSELGDNILTYKNQRPGAVVNKAALEIGATYKPDFSAGLSHFKNKVLFIYGSNNTIYTDSWAEKISAPFINKEILKVSGVGHSGMIDNLSTWSEKTEPNILRFLKAL